MNNIKSFKLFENSNNGVEISYFSNNRNRDRLIIYKRNPDIFCEVNMTENKFGGYVYTTTIDPKKYELASPKKLDYLISEYKKSQKNPPSKVVRGVYKKDDAILPFSFENGTNLERLSFNFNKIVDIFQNPVADSIGILPSNYYLLMNKKNSLDLILIEKDFMSEFKKLSNKL
jgi:hypothetical protein